MTSFCGQCVSSLIDTIVQQEFTRRVVRQELQTQQQPMRMNYYYQPKLQPPQRPPTDKELSQMKNQ